MRRILLPTCLLLACGVLAGCGGGGGPSAAPSRPAATTQPAAASQPAEAAPGLSGLERSIAAAHAAVSQSQQDAQRASATSAGQ